MTVLSTWCRYELRARWRPLVALALLVALGSGTIIGTVSGARRGRSALDRLEAVTLPADVAALPNQPGFDWDRIRSLPGVAALTTFAVGDYGIAEIPPERQGDVAGFPPADDEVWDTIERPVVLEGRLPDPERDDEVVISPRFARHFGIGVGDTLTLTLSTPEQVDAAFEGEEVTDRTGPEIPASVVGVIRSPWFTDTTDVPYGGISPSPGLYAQHEANLVGTAGYVNALVRLDDGAAGIPAFKDRLAEITGREDIDVWDLSERDAHIRHVTGFEANSLLAFALAGMVAGMVLIGEATTRYSTTIASELEILRSLGLSRAARRTMTVVGPTAAGILGVAAGVVGAATTSDRFPIGTASAFEPRPGRLVDWVVVSATMITVPALIAVASLSGDRHRRAGAAPHRTASTAVRRVAARLPTPLAVGTHLTFDRGVGLRGIRVRPAIAGAIVGVAGVIGALTFSAGVHDATSSYDRFGQTYDLVAFFGFNGEDMMPTADALETVARDSDVRGVVDAPMDVGQVGDRAVSLFGYEPVGDGIDVVVLDGRMPNRTDEVVLAPQSADAIGVSVGDMVTIEGTTSTVEATVTGLAFVPSGPHNGYASGGWLTGGGYDRLFDGFKFHFGLADTAPDADVQTVISRLAEQGVYVDSGPIIPPAEKLELAQIERIPLWLAAFLALLAVGALGHTVASTARVRNDDLMVLRAVGFTRGQTRLTLFTVSTLIAAVGYVVGLPLGIAAGRTLWRVVANSTPVELVEPTAWGIILSIPLVAFLAANLLAVWPAHRVARQRVGNALRTE